MALRSIKDHVFYNHMKQMPLEEVAAWVLGETPIIEAEAQNRKAAFRRIAKRIMSSRETRTKYGFNSDTNGEIARAMEWAFKAGMKAGQATPVKPKKSA